MRRISGRTCLPDRPRRLVVLVVGLGTLAVPTIAGAEATTDRTPSVQGMHWVGAWEGSPESGGPVGRDQTYRLFVHTSIGGSSLRLRFSNSYGTEPVRLRDVTVAMPVGPPGPGIKPATLRRVRFPGGSAVTIPVGANRYSQPVRFDVPGDAWLAVSFYAPGAYSTTTWHKQAWGANWQTPAGAGDHAADPGGGALAVPTTSWTYLSGVDVEAPMTTSTVVALGDSITDCCMSVPGANGRWPDLLDRRIAAQPGAQRLSVIDAGISGNNVSDNRNGNATQGEAGDVRDVRDVFDEPNVSTVIVFEGVNDIGTRVHAAGIEAAYRRILEGAHRRGIRVLISTLTPTFAALASGPTYTTNAGTRDQVNRWIEVHRRLFDGVLHFGTVVADPVLPNTWNPLYTIGDQLHPNPFGLQAMADSVPLRLLRG